MLAQAGAPYERKSCTVVITVAHLQAIFNNVCPKIQCQNCRSQFKLVDHGLFDPRTKKLTLLDIQRKTKPSNTIAFIIKKGSTNTSSSKVRLKCRICKSKPLAYRLCRDDTRNSQSQALLHDQQAQCKLLRKTCCLAVRMFRQLLQNQEAQPAM